MIETQNLVPLRSSRLGFHYYPDTVHYRESDLHTWLPELKALRASWLVLQSSNDRAIPENFIQGLIKAEIEPIVQFNLPLTESGHEGDLEPIFAAYARWGIRTVILFDRPNSRMAWPPSGWIQHGLVERFLDRWIPQAALAQQHGLVPLFPALEPCGSYWDTTFLRASLEVLERRNQKSLLENLVLSAYAWSSGRALNWGAGGPERWPEARPYYTPEGQQDQCGFRIFDWYQSVSRAFLGAACPIFLLGAGIANDPLQIASEIVSSEEHAATNMAIARLLAGETVVSPGATAEPLQPVPEEVIAANFWLLTASQNSPFYRQAWYQEDGRQLPVVQQMKEWNRLRQAASTPTTAPEEPAPSEPPVEVSPKTAPVQSQPAVQPSAFRPIRHYLLLPAYEWGISDWHLEVIRPFVKKYRPTVGFSLAEAVLSNRVTVVGNQQTFSDETLDRLQKAGCLVDRISGDGTSIATQLSER